MGEGFKLFSPLFSSFSQDRVKQAVFPPCLSSGCLSEFLRSVIKTRSWDKERSKSAKRHTLSVHRQCDVRRCDGARLYTGREVHLLGIQGRYREGYTSHQGTSGVYTRDTLPPSQVYTRDTLPPSQVHPEVNPGYSTGLRG